MHLCNAVVDNSGRLYVCPFSDDYEIIYRHFGVIADSTKNSQASILYNGTVDGKIELSRCDIDIFNAFIRDSVHYSLVESWRDELSRYLKSWTVGQDTMYLPPGRHIILPGVNVIYNYGYVILNYGTLEHNLGTVHHNFGTIDYNDVIVDVNHSDIFTNAGIIIKEETNDN